MNADDMYALLRQFYENDLEAPRHLPDQASLDLIYGRLVEFAGRRQMPTYGELVAGIPFRQPYLYGDNVHYIEPGPWIGQDRRMIGTALAHIAIQRLQEADALITCIVTLQDAAVPSSVLFDWLTWCGVLPENDEGAVMRFWGEQVAATFRWGRRMRLAAHVIPDQMGG